MIGRYYDLLYQGKDYAGEAARIHDLIGGESGQQILDLGCGTGLHARHLARDHGHRVHGLDNDPEMIALARENCRDAPGVRLTQGDLRVLAEDPGAYDAAVSLFHVINFLGSYEGVDRLFEVVSRHLKPDGWFIFDCWPSNPDLRLTCREVHGENGFHLVRISEPSSSVEDGKITLRMQAFVRENADNDYQRYEQELVINPVCHNLIAHQCDQHGFEIVTVGQGFGGTDRLFALRKTG